jgi:hypothetical protein
MPRRVIRECLVGAIEGALQPIEQGQEPLLTSNQVDIPYAYVIYDHGRTARLALIRDWLANFDMILAGRYG